MIKIKVDGSVVSVQETQALYCGSQDVYTCSFTFDTSWERFSKSAVFRVNGKAVTALLDEENGCILPWELLVRSNIGQEIEVGMYGVSADAEILTSVWDSLGAVREGSELGNDAREPSAGVYEQVMANVQRVDEKVDNYNTEVQAQVQRAESAAAVALGSAESATESAVTAESSAATADSAKEAVLNAIDNLPVGSTLVINDLTTGGTTAALSAEMGKVLSRRPNPNLLHNWYFANPVNQRGQTEYTAGATGWAYSIDRWKMTNATLTKADGFWKFTTAQGGYKRIDQLTEHTLKAGEVYTLSMLAHVNGISVAAFRPCTSAYGAITTTTGGTGVTIRAVTTKPEVFTYTFTPTQDVPNAGAEILVSNASEHYADIDVYAIKLEKGNVQTLAHQDASGNWVLNEIPDYGEELAKCQRYQQVIENATGGATIAAWGMVMNTTAVGFVIPLSSTMRIGAPAVTFSNVEWCLGSSYGDIPTNATLSAVRIAGNALQVLVTFPTAHEFEVGSIVGLRLTKTKNARVLLDANL